MRSPPHRRGFDDERKHAAPSPSSARAKEILHALRDVLREAQARGIELSASFLHFDRRQQGLVGVEDLMEALTELHILSPSIVWGGKDVEECVYEIAAHRSTAYFSRDDFIVYFSSTQPHNDENAFRNEPVATSKMHKKKGKVEMLMSDEEPMRPTFSLSNNNVGVDDDEAKVPKKVRAKKRPLGSLLPNWAHARSKRALKELEELTRKRGTGVVRPLSRSVGAPGFDVPTINLPSADEGVYDKNQGSETQRSETSGQSSSRSNASNENENVPGAEASIVQFPDSPHYRHFDIDSDTSLSYVILKHDPFSSSPRRVPKTPGASACDESASEPMVMSPFRFTVFLDAFQRIEAVEAFFHPLLVHFPRGKILICGFPIKMRRQTVLNDEFLASAYARLLVHLMQETREWLVQPKIGIAAMPQYVLAFGSGTQVAIHLLTTEIPMQAASYPMLELFVKAQRGLVLVNALVNVAGDKRVREAWSSWRRMLSTNENEVEWHEALVKSMFSPHYLSQPETSRVKTMERFFSSRKAFLLGPGLELLQSLIQGVIKSTASGMDTLANLSVVTTQPFGVIAVHCTNDNLCPASQAQALGQALPLQADSVPECLKMDHTNTSPPLFVAWLKSGHEVVQERTGYMLKLMRQLVLVPTKEHEAVDATAPQNSSQPSSEPLITPGAPTDNETQATESPISHSISTDQPGQESAPTRTLPPPPTPSVIADRVRQQLAEHGLKWIQQELYDRDMEGSGTTESILRRYEEALLTEARQEHEKRQKELAKQLKQEAYEAEKLARQAEEIERAIRARETIKTLQRKEHEAQKAFFAQMEKQKELHAKWLDEHQRMELEDALSVKFNDQCRLQEAREDRNQLMGRQVAALERERREQERERYQVELQRQRLEKQHKQREELKTFQQEFEQNQFVCSAVEAYQLDLMPEYSKFLDIVAGTRVLAQDLARFYELKVLQLDENVEKRELLDKTKKDIGERELALRNMERVLNKAKQTGMIAKAGLGTVRIVPISAAEIQQLTREFDEKRDELTKILYDQNMLSQQIAWQDKMLQRLSVLIKRNEGFRTEVLAKLVECLDKGNEMVLGVREDIETVMEKRDTNQKLAQRIKIRLQLVNNEGTRAQAATTQYFDSTLRIEGSTQRVLKSILLKELAVEREALEKRLTGTVSEEATVQARLKQLKTTLEEYAGVTYTVEQVKAKLDAVVPLPTKAQQTKTNSADGVVADVSAAVEDGSLADRVRRKLHTDRSTDEKKWVALDFELNFAYYYKHIELAQVEIIQKHPDYQDNKLKRPQLERLLTLPSRSCLAMAFIKTNEELEAYTLLRKYTFGEGDEFFSQLDKDFELPGDETPPAAVVSTLEEVVNAVEKVDHPVLRAKSVLFVEKPPNDSLQKPPSIRLLSASQQQIAPHKTVTHNFRLPTSGPAIGVLSLMVSIVFQGHFKATGYQNGRLAGMLYALPTSKVLISGPVPIGKCISNSDIALCTPHSLGKLVIRHDPAKKPVSADVTYQVVLGAPVLTTYSIEITATTALFASEVLRTKRLDALKKQELFPAKKDEIVNVFTTVQLSERKKRLARKMANEAKEIGRQAELEMLRNTKLLEEDNAVPILPQENRKALHAKIHAAEAKFTQQCFLFAQREEEVRDIEAGLKELTKIHADLLEEVDTMERDLMAYREQLPPLAAVLAESRNNGERDAAGARLAKELNVEYVSRFGGRSGKVFWAELSAMKAKLPSMMTPAERLRRKYKKGVDVLEKKEREWIIIDRILYPRLYEWEERLVIEGSARMRLNGTHTKLTKDEEQLAVLSQMEVERIMKAPWNLLERKEIQVRKIVTRFRDEGATGKRVQKPKTSPTTVATMLRGLKLSELTTEEREWRAYDQLMNPVYYPLTLKNIAEDLASLKEQASVAMRRVPPHITREDLVTALNTPEEELFKLPSDLLHAHNLLLKFDPQLSVNLVEAARMQHALENQALVEKVEVDVDARCRLVYAELQRAIANTRNEFMDSSALHTTLQRFPTKVLRLELEKELDRILISQITEKEQFAMENFLKKGGNTKQIRRQEMPSPARVGNADSDGSISDSDSDDEAQIAREKRDQRQVKEAAKQGKGAKVRGKALTTKAIQKQRREIKDALQGRSLEGQRRLVQERELGDGGCMACRTNPCSWKPFLKESFVTIQARMEVLQEELERVKRCTDLVITSTVCLAAVKSGNRAVTMRKVDLFDEVTAELKVWDRNLRLRNVDKEFHDTFTSKEQYFETQALHGFRQIQQKDKVSRALQREHNVLVSNLIAYEVVEDILEYMLEGWVFGERESERKVLGYVPSLKREGPLTMYDLRRLEEEKRIQDAQADLVEEQNVQGIPLEKWKPIEVMAFGINEKNKAVKKGSMLDKQLTETEQALKFGIFCMTLMYFRGLSLLKKQKTVWSTSALKGMAKQPVASAETKRMELEARNVAARQKKAQLFDEKARIGQARKAKLEEQRTASYRRRLVLENQKAKREAHAAVEIQRIFRGFTGRRAGKRWMLRRREIEAQRALDKAAAITLQRAYRGRLGRFKAEERRIELAEFISQIRAEEAIEEEEEYWRTHRVERVLRQVGAYITKQP